MTTTTGELITPTGRLVLPPNADRAQWLEYRRWREDVPGGFCIGSSEVPSLLDLDGVDTPAHIYRLKRGMYKRPPTEPMIWGSLLESAVAAEWTRRNRCVTDEIGLVSRDGTPHHQCTIDRRVRECPIKPEMRDNCGCEIKVVGYSSAQRWGRDLPDRILAQVLHQLWVTGFDHMHVACLIGGNMMRQMTVYREREQDLIDYIVVEVDAFRDRYLLPGVEPAWDTSRKAAQLIEMDSLSHPDRVGEIGLDEIGDLLSYAEAAAAEGAARKRKERALAALRQHADGHETVTFSGDRAYWFGTQRRSKVDLERLAEKYPDAYADPEIVSETVSHPIYIDRAYRVRQT